MESLINRFKNYIIINGSFQDDIGLINGKSSILLFLSQYYYENPTDYNSDIFYSFLDEILLQKSTADGTYGNGVFGSATVIQYLINNKHINEEEFKDFFKEIDDKLISYIFYNDILSIHFTNGLAGYLAYCYHRIESKSLSELDKLKIEEVIIHCITRIYLKLSEDKMSGAHTVLNEEYLSEYIKTLSIITVCKKYNLLIPYINDIEAILLDFIKTKITNCKDIVALIEFYNFNSVSSLENIKLDFNKLENTSTIKNLSLNQGIYVNYLLNKMNLKNANRLIKKVDNMIQSTLKKPLNKTYPYQITQKRVNVGFWEGASMYPILSLIQKNNNHDLALLYGIL